MGPGLVDPLFLFELAEKQGKSVQELCTGEPGMSAHELCVEWPAYYAAKNRIAQREAQEQKERSRRV